MTGGTGPVRSYRVLQLLWSGRIGGIERQIAAVARYGRAHGTGEHRTCFLDGRGSIGDALLAEGLADRLEFRAGWDPIGLWRLGRLLRRQRPDVVHSHTHALLPTVIARLVLPRAAFVYTEHSPRALASDTKFRLLYRLLRLSQTRYIALSPSMARTLERYDIKPEQTVTIPNIHAISPSRATAPRRKQPPTIGIIARLERQKRVDLLIEVVGELRRRGIACTGLVVGGGRGQADLISQADRLGLQQVVEFAGEQDDVVPWLDRMEVFLMTSVVEPFGITALEAMARRVPVVAMPCPGGLSDLVARGGMLLADRTIGTAADVVTKVIQSEHLRRELQVRGDATAKEHTAERIFPALERLYSQVLGARPLSRPIEAEGVS
jgi:glycosyltransferase involved in cell wall biosynthesis